MYLFAGIIGDLFPAHVNEEYCKRMPYGTRLVHGCLTFSLCSTVSGMAGWTAAMTFWPWDMTR